MDRKEGEAGMLGEAKDPDSKQGDSGAMSDTPTPVREDDEDSNSNGESPSLRHSLSFSPEMDDDSPPRQYHGTLGMSDDDAENSFSSPMLQTLYPTKKKIALVVANSPPINISLDTESDGAQRTTSEEHSFSTPEDNKYTSRQNTLSTSPSTFPCESQNINIHASPSLTPEEPEDALTKKAASSNIDEIRAKEEESTGIWSALWTYVAGGTKNFQSDASDQQDPAFQNVRKYRNFTDYKDFPNYPLDINQAAELRKNYTFVSVETNPNPYDNANANNANNNSKNNSNNANVSSNSSNSAPVVKSGRSNSTIASRSNSAVSSNTTSATDVIKKQRSRSNTGTDLSVQTNAQAAVQASGKTSEDSGVENRALGASTGGNNGGGGNGEMQAGAEGVIVGGSGTLTGTGVAGNSSSVATAGGSTSSVGMKSYASNASLKSGSSSTRKLTRRPLGKQSRMKLYGTNCISGVSLALWDNILGPRVEMIWDGTESLDDEIVKYCSRQVMSGEIDKMVLLEMQGMANKQQPVHKFHVFSDLGYCCTSIVFVGPYMGSSTKLAFTLLLKRESLDRYLPLNKVVEDRLFHLQARLKDLLEVRPQQALEIFTTQLSQFSLQLNALYMAGIENPRHPPQWLIEKHPSPGIDFVARALTSHLQTHCTTVVTGKDESAINSMIELLALCLSATQRRRSSMVTIGRSYVPDLILQGVLSGQKPITDDDVIQALYPTTIIDLDRHSIVQTHPFHVHTVLRREFMSLQRKHMVGARTGRNLWLAQHVKESAPMVNSLLEECNKLPPHLRDGMMREWMRVVVRKAVVLIKYVEALTHKRQIIDTNVIKKLRVQLDALNEADFAILLAVAENYSPGIYFTLAGDPASIEEKFIQLFESF